MVRVSRDVKNSGQYSFVEGKDGDFYLKLAGGATDSADFALVTYPEGFVKKSNFPWIVSESPDIRECTVIFVTKGNTVDT